MPKEGDEERMAKQAYAWHHGGPQSDIKMPMLNKEMIMSWSKLERQRYFESGGLYLPATKQIGPPPEAAEREDKKRWRRRERYDVPNQMGMDSCADELREYFRMRERGEPLRVALVGNGPLSEADRAELHHRDFAIVVRFNDQKNYRVGDAPTTLHVCRCRVDGYDAPFCGLALYKRHAPLLLLGDPVTLCKPLNEFRGVYKCPDGKYYDVAASLDLSGTEFFPGEAATDFTREKEKHPSAGLWAIGIFQIIPEVSEIHTFGMNFNFKDERKGIPLTRSGGRYCHSTEEGDLVRDPVFFPKVTVHATPNNHYDPHKELNALTEGQRSIDMTGFANWSSFMTANPRAMKQGRARNGRGNPMVGMVGMGMV
jgi:hypothetical protein